VIEEAKDRHVTYTTVLYERLGIYEKVRVNDRATKTNKKMDKEMGKTPSGEVHEHVWLNRSPVSGLKRCRDCRALKA